MARSASEQRREAEIGGRPYLLQALLAGERQRAKAWTRQRPLPRYAHALWRLAFDSNVVQKELPVHTNADYGFFGGWSSTHPI